MLETNEMKVLRKKFAKEKQIEYEVNKSENPAVSNLLSGWKDEEQEQEENESNV